VSVPPQVGGATSLRPPERRRRGRRRHLRCRGRVALVEPAGPGLADGIAALHADEAPVPAAHLDRIGLVEEGEVVSRGDEHSPRPRHPQRGVFGERLGAVGVSLDEACEHDGVLERHRRAHPGARRRRMRRVAEQDDALGSPTVERVAEVDRRDQRLVGLLDQGGDVAARPDERPPQVLGVGRRVPRLRGELPRPARSRSG
jgi:hypothetical protein